MDFAARLLWSVTPDYDAANHRPTARIPQSQLDIDVTPGERVQLVGVAKDPDGDDVTSKWWQYREAGTYPGVVTVTKKGSGRSPVAQFDVPPGREAGPDDPPHLRGRG